MKNAQLPSSARAGKLAAAGALSLGLIATGALSATGASAQEVGGPTSHTTSSSQWSSYRTGATAPLQSAPVLASTTTPTASTSSSWTSSTGAAVPASSTAASTASTTTTATATATAITTALGQSAATGAYGTPNAALVSSLGLKSPLASTSVLYGFGLRTLNGVTDNHTGLDLAASQGTTVMAAGSGTVTFAGWHSYGGGNRIEITHSNGVVTTYNHLSAINVTVGQTVTAGQAIGAVGATGNASGPHLHFEVLQNGAWTNPAVWLGLS